MAKMKLLNKDRLIGAAQGALWAGLGTTAAAMGGGYLRANVGAIGSFANTPTKRALVDGATGLLLSGVVAGLLGRRNSTAAKKAAAYMGAGALLGTVYPIVAAQVKTMTGRPGGRRLPTVTQQLPAASAAPSTAMLRAGGGIVMGAPAVDVGQAVRGLSRPGGRYINPRYEWASVRGL